MGLAAKPQGSFTHRIQGAKASSQGAWVKVSEAGTCGSPPELGVSEGHGSLATVTGRPAWALFVGPVCPQGAHHSSRRHSLSPRFLPHGLQPSKGIDCWAHGSFTRAARWTDPKGVALVSLCQDFPLGQVSWEPTVKC